MISLKTQDGCEHRLGDIADTRKPDAQYILQMLRLEIARIAATCDGDATMNGEQSNSHVLIGKTTILRGKESKVPGRFEWLQDTLVCIIFAICFFTAVSAAVLVETKFHFSVLS